MHVIARERMLGIIKLGSTKKERRYILILHTQQQEGPTFIPQTHDIDQPLRLREIREKLNAVPGVKNIHHRVPKCCGGKYTLRTCSRLSIESEHIPWHQVYFARDAYCTAQHELAIQNELGSSESIALYDLQSKKLVLVTLPTFSRKITSWHLEVYEKFRRGQTQTAYYKRVNAKFNDPFFKWCPVY